MPHNIDLSKPLLEQKTVREMLGLSLTENTPKVSLDDLIKVAVHIIKTELADCNCDESELGSLKLEYTLPHPNKPNLVETSVLHWRQQPLEKIPDTQPKGEVGKLPDGGSETELQKFSAQKSSGKFMNRLAGRINEAVFAAQPSALESSISWELQSMLTLDLNPDEKLGGYDTEKCPKQYSVLNRSTNAWVRCISGVEPGTQIRRPD